MNIEDAKAATMMACREFPDGKYDFLRCQIGEWIPTKVQVSVWKTVMENVFHLIAYGHDWERAVENYDKWNDKKKAKAAGLI